MDNPVKEKMTEDLKRHCTKISEWPTNIWKECQHPQSLRICKIKQRWYTIHTSRKANQRKKTKVMIPYIIKHVSQLKLSSIIECWISLLGCCNKVLQSKCLQQKRSSVSQLWRLKMWSQGVSRASSFWGL